MEDTTAARETEKNDDAPIRPFALRKKASTVDYSILGGKWGTPVTSSNSHTFRHSKGEECEERERCKGKGSVRGLLSSEDAVGTKVGGELRCAVRWIAVIGWVIQFFL